MTSSSSDNRSRAARQAALERSRAFRLMETTTRLSDRLFFGLIGLDALLGFFLPAAGDALAVAAVLPALYVAAVRLHSVPLALAVVYNSLLDWLIGLVPLAGDVADVFFRSNTRNCELIRRYAEGHAETRREVRRKAALTAVGIGLLCLLIYGTLRLVAWGVAAVGAWLAELF